MARTSRISDGTNLLTSSAQSGIINEYGELMFAPAACESAASVSTRQSPSHSQPPSYASSVHHATMAPACHSTDHSEDAFEREVHPAYNEKASLDAAERGALLPTARTVRSPPRPSPLTWIRDAFKRDLASPNPWTRFWICFTPFLVLFWWIHTKDAEWSRGQAAGGPTSWWSSVRPTTDLTASQLALAHRCHSLPPLPSDTYPNRLRTLASALRDHGGDGGDQDVWLAEPGASAVYYTNIGSGNWSLSERTFLVVVKAAPSFSGADTAVSSPRLSILTPRFELDRAKLLRVPGLEGHGAVSYVDWAEDASPFEALLDHLDLIDAAADAGVKASPRRSRIHLDPAVRTFIGSGIRKALTARGYTDEQVVVDVATRNVLAIRERKSEREIELLRCANELTLEAIRATKESMHFGISESETRPILERNLAAFGLKNAGGLILFGENAALPHGSGTDRQLGKSDFVLIDAGGSFRGYISDITRTFALPGSRITKTQARVWDTVRAAQQAALIAGREGTRAADVDAAARKVIESRGESKSEREGFTHRLGHGIGLEGHESPYLVGSNPEPIERGNVFSDEPGVYVLGEYGVRLEDCWFVDEDGKGQLFTGPAESYWDI